MWGDGGQCPSHSRPHDIAAAGRVAVIVGESRCHLPRLHQQHLCLATSPYPPAHAGFSRNDQSKADWATLGSNFIPGLSCHSEGHPWAGEKSFMWELHQVR